MLLYKVCEFYAMTRTLTSSASIYLFIAFMHPSIDQCIHNIYFIVHRMYQLDLRSSLRRSWRTWTVSWTSFCPSTRRRCIRSSSSRSSSSRSSRSSSIISHVLSELCTKTTTVSYLSYDPLFNTWRIWFKTMDFRSLWVVICVLAYYDSGPCHVCIDWHTHTLMDIVKNKHFQ